MIRKSKMFTQRQGHFPGQVVKLEVPPCAYCSSRSTTRCEIPLCNLPMCAKHRVRKAGGNLCRQHQNAILVQPEGVATERFGDRGEAMPHFELKGA
jgi:hypothetical protein